MATPIVEQVAAFLAAALAEITEANGWRQDLSVVRAKGRTFDGDISGSASGSTAILLTGEAIEDMDLLATGSAIVRQPFQICVIMIDSDDETDTIERRLSQAVADIEKKLAVDTSCGGLADWLEVTGFEYEVTADEGDYSLVRINVIAHLDLDDDNPYALAG